MKRHPGDRQKEPEREPLPHRAQYPVPEREREPRLEREREPHPEQEWELPERAELLGQTGDPAWTKEMILPKSKTSW